MGDYVLFTYFGLSYPFLSTYEHFKLSLLEPTAAFRPVMKSVPGEIFEVSDETLARIDRMEIGAGYRREKLTEDIYVYLYVKNIQKGAVIVQNNDWMIYVKEHEQSYWNYCQKQAKTALPKKTYYRNNKGQFCKDMTLKTIFLENITLPVSELKKVIDILKKNNCPFTES
jgi:gamma-glutamylcyclotransferase (GGCT)/AIG2-like uncharacterized protein YtfP